MVWHSLIGAEGLNGVVQQFAGAALANLAAVFIPRNIHYCSACVMEILATDFIARMLAADSVYGMSRK